MPNIELKDILIAARQEAYRMRHFYIGAEHLFIALLQIRGSLASHIVQHYGLTPEYVINAIRRKLGKGGKHRLWADVPKTPRAEVILSIANDLALDNGREQINERDILIALFEEYENIPMRVLIALGLNNPRELIELAQNTATHSSSQQPYIRIDFGQHFEPTDKLSRDEAFILRRMFYGYSQIRVERRLTSGYSSATLLVVTPIHVDKREDAAVIVKINQVDSILDEAQRYEAHVKTKLPPMTARIEDKPIAPEQSDLAGIKYTLIAGYDRVPKDLRAIMATWTPKDIGEWLKNELFPPFSHSWWKQNRPFRFQVWREYDWLLPPVLTLEFSQKEFPSNGHVIRMPIKRAKLRRLDYGDVVAVENFIVQRVYPDRNTIQLAVGNNTDSTNAYKIEVRGVNLEENTYYRGEVVENLVGTVWQTRAQQLLLALRALEPDFDAQAEKIPINNEEKIPNPILAYEGLLDSYVNGTLCTIHGDLHPGNIMIGPNQSAFLIDFAHTRDGHTIFDWVTLENSILNDYVMSATDGSWDAARMVVNHIIKLNGGEFIDTTLSPAIARLETVRYIREIARQCLAEDDKWSEYYTALVFCGLRTLTWETASIGGRRLMYLVAGLAIRELRTRFRPSSSSETPSPDDTDMSLSL